MSDAKEAVKKDVQDAIEAIANDLKAQEEVIAPVAPPTLQESIMNHIKEYFGGSNFEAEKALQIAIALISVAGAFHGLSLTKSGINKFKEIETAMNLLQDSSILSFAKHINPSN